MNVLRVALAEVRESAANLRDGHSVNGNLSCDDDIREIIERLEKCAYLMALALEALGIPE